MRPFQFFFNFSKSQQKGIVALFFLIFILQVIYYVINSLDFTTKEQQVKEEAEWLALQSEIDALKTNKNRKKDTIYPFNPNYISDFKGYILGMSVVEIDRLHKFRKSGKFVNSIFEFQEITGVKDSLLATLSPYFKFPEWVQDKKNVVSFSGNLHPVSVKSEIPIMKLDINEALEEDLVKIYDIGPSYAKMLLRYRAQLGAFVSMDQMDDFNTLSAEAKDGLKNKFIIGQVPRVNKINVNTASLHQLTRFPYFNKDIARAVITQRSMNGKILNIDELLRITGFPIDKVKIIALYLEF